jgi:hypothetical protein
MIASINDHLHAPHASYARLHSHMHSDFYFWTRHRLHSHMYSDFYFQTRPQLPHVVYSRAKRAISHYAQHAQERDCSYDLVYFFIFISIVSPS